MQNNDDLINDILNELDGQRNSPPEEAPVSPDEPYSPEPEPAHDVITSESEVSANEDIFLNDYQNYYQDSSPAPETAEEVYTENGEYQDNGSYSGDYGYPPTEEYPPQRNVPRKKKKKKKRRTNYVNHFKNNRGQKIISQRIFCRHIVEGLCSRT